MDPRCDPKATAPGRELVAKLAKMFNDDNLASLRYLKDVPPGRGSTVYDLFKYLEEQGMFIPSKPSTIIPFLEDIERLDMLGVAKEWLEIKGYGNPEIGYAEVCIRDAIVFLDKMDQKIQDAAQSKDISEVTHHMHCLRDILATAKTLVGRCLESVTSPIYAEVPDCEMYSYIKRAESTAITTEYVVDKSQQAPKQQTMPKQPPTVAPKPKRLTSRVSSEANDCTDCSDGSDNTGTGDSGICDRRKWITSLPNLDDVQLLEGRKKSTVITYTKLVPAHADESGYMALRHPS